MTRDTRQRRAIREVFSKADGPLGPQEVLDRAQQEVPGIGLATIYRTIKLMIDDQELHPVELPGEPPRYEPAERHLSHHHFFKCDTCGRVYEVQGCVNNPSALAPEGFTVSRHEIVLYGVCANCA